MSDQYQIVVNSREKLVTLGPNGCGKSTLFDVFGFLSDALQTNVRKAIEPRGRLPELRSQSSSGPIGITVRYRESEFEVKKPGPDITDHSRMDHHAGQAGGSR
jgi:predicted ATPase